MTNIIITLIVCFILCTPCQAQFSPPGVGVKAPPAIKYFRVAIVPRLEFQSEALAKYASQELKREFPGDFFNFKVLPSGKKYKVAYMVRIMFFERDQAEAALNFLKENPKFDGTKYELQIINDSSY